MLGKQEVGWRVKGVASTHCLDERVRVNVNSILCYPEATGQTVPSESTGLA